jgi:hypothetical protein
MIKKWIDIKQWKDVKTQLKILLEDDDRSHLAIFKDAGLSTDTYYKLMDDDRDNKPMRKATIQGLAKALNIECTFHNGFPFFGTINIHLKTKNGPTVREIVELAIKHAEYVHFLSLDTGIPDSELNSIINSDSKFKTISLKDFRKIVNYVGLNLSIWSDNSIVLMDKAAQVTELDLFFQERSNLPKHNPEDILDAPGISDKGLLELIEPNNREKHNITEHEIKELASIHRSRNSKGTIDQWVTILYVNRSLDT